MTTDRSSQTTRRWQRLGLAWVAGLCALGATSVAQARDLNWSIGIASPGVSVGVSNQQPMVVYPQPYYVQPQPVYQYQVRPMPGYVQPVVVYPQPAVVYGPPGWRHKHRHRHDRDRWDRDDDDRRWR